MSLRLLRPIQAVTVWCVLAGLLSNHAVAQSAGEVVARVAGENGSMMDAQDLVAYYRLMVGPQGDIDPAVAQDFFAESVREWSQQQQLSSEQAVRQLQEAFADQGGMPEGLANQLLTDLAVASSDDTPPAYLPAGPLTAAPRPASIVWPPWFGPTFKSGMSRLSESTQSAGNP